MAILTYPDLERFMGKTFTATQQEAAATILAALENELSYHLNRPLGATLYTSEAYRLEVNQRQIFLRHAPVRTVTGFSVGLEGEEVAQNISDYDIYPWGIDNIRIAGTGYRALVTYTAGMYDSETLALERVLYSAAAREMGKFLIDAQGLSQLDVEGTKYRIHAGGESGFTQDEMKAVSRFKRRVIR